MKMNELVPRQIFTISDVLCDEECDDYIKYSEQQGFADAPINALGGFVMRKDVRNNTRVMLDNQSVADYVWQRIKQFMPLHIEGWRPVGLNERIRFYRYEPGQYFAPHYDGCFRRDNGEESKLTLMLYLNSNCRGGETRFDLRYPYGEVVVIPKKGSALCFDHYLLHEGAPVVEGVKYVLRTDVMFKQS